MLTQEAFTATELDMLGALTVSSVEGPSRALSDVPLHPVLAKKIWEKEIPKHWALYPVRNGNGYWEVSKQRSALCEILVYWLEQASNPVVWEAMLPSLQLSSMILTRPETLLWCVFSGMETRI